MTDYRNLFGYAFIVLAIAFFIRSFAPAHALNGPNISMGNNPIESYIGSTSGTILNNTTTSNFIVTDIACDYSANVYMDSAQVFFCLQGSHSFTSGIKVPPGSRIQGSSNRTIFISGYYAH